MESSLQKLYYHRHELVGRYKISISQTGIHLFYFMLFILLLSTISLSNVTTTDTMCVRVFGKGLPTPRKHLVNAVVRCLLWVFVLFLVCVCVLVSRGSGSRGFTIDTKIKW